MRGFAISSDGTRIAYETMGSGPTIILVHGLAGDRNGLIALAESLAADFRTIRYDRRGRGDSKTVSPYDFRQEAEDLKAVSTTVGTPVFYAGFAMGALVVLEALRQGHGPLAAILFEPPIDAPGSVSPKVADALDEMQQYLDAEHPEGAVEVQLHHLLQKSEDEIEEERRNSEAWRRRVAEVPMTLRDLRIVHGGMIFDPKGFPDPGCAVKLYVGSKTIPFIKASASRVEQLPFVEAVHLEGLDHGAYVTAPIPLANAIRSSLRPLLQ